VIKQDRISLSDGGGGRSSAQLIEGIFLTAYGNKTLRRLEDSAQLTLGKNEIAFTTDSYVIKPIFFPGGDIGRLAVCGTVNDLAVKGATPLALSVGFIIEEGFLVDDLKKIARSICSTAVECKVEIAAGDTKVVARGEADGIFINTSGIGLIMDDMDISCSNAKVGDDIIITGTIADHGISILNVREGLGFKPEIQSDLMHMDGVVEEIASFGKGLHVMRDPTRGGLASTLNEIARSSKVNIEIFEDKIPLRREVEACCELLGLDPLYVANEGKVVIFSAPNVTTDLITILGKHRDAKGSAIIGKVTERPYSQDTPPVSLVTSIGTNRFVPLAEGIPLPRIC